MSEATNQDAVTPDVDDDATARALLVLLPDVTALTKKAKRIRRQVLALANRHGVGEAKT